MMKKIILNPASMLLIGLLSGVVSRLLDLYTTNLGNIFSQLAIWILFGVLIAIYSSTKRAAVFNVFPFLRGDAADLLRNSYAHRRRLQ